MHDISGSVCPKCGKILYGVTLCYGGKWDCSKCAKDKTDVLHCEQGGKVIAVNLDNGYKSDSEKAHKFLNKGQIYEVDRLWVGGWNSTIYLKEFPNEGFNTAHFKRYEHGCEL